MHNLNFNEQTNKYAFFSKQEIAWHQLGQVVTEYLTSSEAIKAAQLNFTVVIAPNIHMYPSIGDQWNKEGKDSYFTFNTERGDKLSAKLQNGTMPDQNAPASFLAKVSDDSFYTYRTDNGDVLGNKLGKEYHVVQNEDAFSFFDAIVGGEGGIMYETAGALGKGETIFITAKLPDYIRVGSGDDVLQQYLFLTTSHDGSGSIVIGFTPIRIVCNNTLNAALRNCTNVKRFRHTANVKDRLLKAHEVMEMTNTMSEQLSGILNQMAKVRISDPEVKRLIQIALASKETRALLKDGKEAEASARFKNAVAAAEAYAQGSPSQQLDTTKGTVYGAYNAITGYFQNVREYKSLDTKMEALYYGGYAQQRSQIVFDLCESYMKYGSDALILN